MKISATIITLNEAANIREACESVGWADEIVVVDSGSADNTREIARRCGARVLVNEWPGFAAQKQFAAEASVNDWVFSLDADERVSPELRAGIESLKGGSGMPPTAGYRIPRRTWYMGKWIRGGGWYPDYQLRLYDRREGRWQGAWVHESVKMNDGAAVGTLTGDILHYTIRSASEHHRMIGERYAPLGAKKAFEEGRRTSAPGLALAAPAAFIRSFFLRGGFRDGLAGLSIAAFAAHHAFLKNLLLWEMQREAETDASEPKQS